MGPELLSADEIEMINIIKNAKHPEKAMAAAFELILELLQLHAAAEENTGADLLEAS